MLSLPLGRKGEESAHSGQFTGCRGGTEPLPSPVGQKSTQVGGAKIEKARRVDLIAAVAAEELDEPMRRCLIGPHGVLRASAIMLEMRCPFRDERLGRVN